MKKCEILVGSKQDILNYIKPLLPTDLVPSDNRKSDLLITISGIENQINDLKNQIGLIFYLEYVTNTHSSSECPDVNMILKSCYVHIKENHTSYVS